MKKTNIVLFKTSDGAFSMPVRIGEDSAWLTQAQMSQLFGKDRTVIGRHIANAIREGEVDPKVVCAKFAHTTHHGAMPGRTQTQEVVAYNLDVVISVGYRSQARRR